MAALDLQAQALAWALDETQKQCFAEDYGVTVFSAPVPAQTPQGPRAVPGWLLVLTCRNPLLGEGPLFHGPVPVGVPEPVEAEIRAQVADGVRQLRDLASSKLAGLNGGAPKVPLRGSR